MLNEKTLELNICAEFLKICRRYDPHAFVFGTTLKQEKYRGYDSEVFGRLPQFWRAAVFQFKKALRKKPTPSGYEYTFQINNNGQHDQHLFLYLMSGGRPFVSLYVLPHLINLTDIRNQAPNLLGQTYFADAKDISPSLVNNTPHFLITYPSLCLGKIRSEEIKIKLYTLEEVIMAITERKMGVSIEELRANLTAPKTKEAELRSKRPKFTFQIFTR